MARSTERAAGNETRFRDANEHIDRRRSELGLDEQRTPYLCECEDEQCTGIIRLTPSEYRSGRANARRFLVAPGHPFREARVVDQRDSYLVIEKGGKSGEIAEEEAR